MKSLVVLAAVFVAAPVLSADRPSIHGMLLVGEAKAYISHLPMFHTPHDYQALLEVSLGEAAQAKYVADRKATGEPIYTIVPSRQFVLPTVINGRQSFSADLYHGHFERGGTVLVEGLTVTIRDVIHFRKFDPAAKQPTELEYIAFGTPGEQFLAHRIAARPDFDQVIRVNGPVTASGQTFRVATRGQEQPLRKGDDLPSGVTVLEEFYFETGDLAH